MTAFEKGICMLAEKEKCPSQPGSSVESSILETSADSIHVTLRAHIRGMRNFSHNSLDCRTLPFSSCYALRSCSEILLFLWLFQCAKEWIFSIFLPCACEQERFTQTPLPKEGRALSANTLWGIDSLRDNVKILGPRSQC